MMHVLHLTYADSIGGAGRSATRLHENLSTLDVDSRMLVMLKTAQDDLVQLYEYPNLFFKIGDRIGERLNYILGLQDIFIPSSHIFHRHPWVKQADIIQIFNPWRGYWSFLELPRLSQDKPVVLRLSDQWVYTGHCVYDYGCERWQTGCGACPQVQGERALMFDTSALLWRIKKWAYQRANLVIVAPSNWMYENARKSPLINRFPIHLIHNGVDTEIYHPQVRTKARVSLGLAPHQKAILFSAYVITGDRKGAHLLQEALARLPSNDEVVLLLLGKGEPPTELSERWNVKAVGYIGEDRTLAELYSAADMTIAPSLADNLPNSILESMACGTPAIAFAVGGISDAVQHLETGYLATPFDTASLAKGIQTLLDDDTLRERMSRNCRSLVLEKFTRELEVQQFYDLYQSLLA